MHAARAANSTESLLACSDHPLRDHAGATRTEGVEPSRFESKTVWLQPEATRCTSATPGPTVINGGANTKHQVAVVAPWFWFSGCHDVPMDLFEGQDCTISRGGFSASGGGVPCESASALDMSTQICIDQRYSARTSMRKD